MTLLVDTSVWSLALRRDAEAGEPEVQVRRDALLGDDIVVTTGLVLQELLQGFAGPKAQAQIVQRFAALPLIQPDRTIMSARQESGTFAVEQEYKWALSMRCLLSFTYVTN